MVAIHTIPGEEAMLPVIQADRDAAREFQRIMAMRIMRAVHDHKAASTLGDDEGDAAPIIQAFARHRLAHQSPSRAAGADLPAGMKPWAGGDSAPEDWDVLGPVLLADGELLEPDEEPLDWSHHGGEGGCLECWCIVAYTPKSTPHPVTGNDELTGRHPDLEGHTADEVRDACLAVLGKVVRFDQSREIARRIVTKQAALATPAELPALPPREEIEAVCRRVFLAAHSDGWTGNQLRRDVQHVDAEKSWKLYVEHGALAKTFAALHPPASVAEVEGLREALARRDLKAAECPDAKLDPDKECPRCGAMSNEGCRVTALADAHFVREVRGLATPMPSGEKG